MSHPALEEIDLYATGDTPWWRDRRGQVVHRSTCRHAREPWRDVAGYSDAQIRARVEATPWLAACGHCLPERSER